MDDGDGMARNLPTGNAIECSEIEAEYSSAVAEVSNKYLTVSLAVLSDARTAQLSLCSS
ncbi:hypothetical protein QR46_2016 [Giardia duodenalis assemblage B]|uniref:Uncharacterized protein n=2 Tax=Giardia intestinalis TaxID=5741 RepID=A0A132NV90_GIAIN|nr:Hypothetical protein GSB_150567 [Giardia intestinalis]KWX13990.1 hypothetical protein QR46_2016 [Giardia intestinalis assemblage B]